MMNHNHKMIFLFIALLCASILGTWIFRKLALRYQLMDRPNQRSSHEIPTPRGAGLVFMLLWLLLLAFVNHLGFLNPLEIRVFIPVILILLIGFLDDCHSISAKTRFGIQIFAALMTLIFMHGAARWNIGMMHLHLGWVLGSVLAFLMVLWSSNAFNFMDGIDGIAGVESLFVLIPGGWWVWCKQGYALSALIWGLAAGVAGFLVWNWPKAKIFMGDAGSSSLGFLIIVFALVSQQWLGIPALNWLVLYSLFLFDTTLTLVRRICHKEKWSEGHRLHAYQRLQTCGWSHTKILSWVIVINTLLALLATVMNFYSDSIVVVLPLAFVILIAAYGYVEYRQPMYQ